MEQQSELIHLKISNKHYGFRGIQPNSTTFCQKHLGKEQVPIKFKVTLDKKTFTAMANHDMLEVKQKCCPSCLQGVMEQVKAEDKLQQTINSLDENSFLAVMFEKTSDLKDRYIESTKKYSTNYFKYLEGIVSMDYATLVAKYPRKVFFRTKGDYHNVLNKEGYNLLNKARRIVGKGYINFETEEVDHAILHYIQSVYKLTDRLQKKGIIDSSDVQIFNERVGQNLEMNIKSGNVNVRAWTIIAEGPIQRPHYRYLIK